MKIGKTEEEIDATEMIECRKIVKNLINFGLSERQKLQIIFLLSLEMESRDAINLINSAVKKIKSIDNNVKFSLTNGQDIDYNDQEVKKPKILDV
jgi:hypothetical protein